MRRYALALSVVASLALLNACGSGAGTAFSSNPTSPSQSVDRIAFVQPGSSIVTNVFILSTLTQPTPIPTPSPGPPTAMPSTGPTTVPSAIPTATAAPTPVPTATPPFTVVTPAPVQSLIPGVGAQSGQPALIQGLGFVTGGGVAGAGAVPATQFVWQVGLTPEGTVIQAPTVTGTGFVTCNNAAAAFGTPPRIEVPIAAGRTTGPNGENVAGLIDAKHPTFFFAPTSSGPGSFTTYNYNPIAVFAPPVVIGSSGSAGKTYCLTVVAKAPNGTLGSVYVVVRVGPPF